MSKTRLALSAAALLIGAAALALPAGAQQQQDQVLAQARAAGIIGEQSDGYYGIRIASAATDDIRRRVTERNTNRRAAFVSGAQDAGPPATPESYAAAFACETFSRRVAIGEWYRLGTEWRQHTASQPVQLPENCGN